MGYFRENFGFWVLIAGGGRWEKASHFRRNRFAGERYEELTEANGGNGAN